MRGIGPAPAQIAHHGFLDLLHRGVGVPVEQGLGRDHEAGGAEAALHAAVLDVGFDERMVGLGDAFDRLDGLARALDGQHHAGEHRPAVHDHRAGAAGPFTAELLGAGQSQLLLEHVLEGPLGLHRDRVGFSVHQEIHGVLRDDPSLFDCRHTRPSLFRASAHSTTNSALATMIPFGRMSKRMEDRIMPPSRTSKYIVTELKMPESKQKIDAEYSKFAKRILWLDDQVVEGAFHMNTAWYLRPRPRPSRTGRTCTTATRSSASSATTPTTPTTSAARSRSGWKTRSTSSTAAR